MHEKRAYVPHVISCWLYFCGHHCATRSSKTITAPSSINHSFINACIKKKKRKEALDRESTRGRAYKNPRPPNRNRLAPCAYHRFRFRIQQPTHHGMRPACPSYPLALPIYFLFYTIHLSPIPPHMNNSVSIDMYNQYRT